MKIKTHKTETWVVITLLSLCMVDLGCQSKPGQAPLPVDFKLAGQYTLVAIQIDPPLRDGQDVIAMYADSSGQSPCLSGATIKFDPTGWITFAKPAGCEQNDDLTEITGLQYGEKWSLQDNTLLVESIDQQNQYNVTVNGNQVFLSLDIDRGYASSLDDNPSGFTLTIELERL